MPRRKLAVLSQPPEEFPLATLEEGVASIKESNTAIQTTVQGIQSNTGVDGLLNTRLKSIDEELQRMR